MSSSLFWREPPTNPNGHALGFRLKKILGPKLWNHDGSLGGEWIVIGPEFIDYLHGVADGGDSEVATDAAKLIDAILKHGTVEVGIFN